MNSSSFFLVHGPSTPRGLVFAFLAFSIPALRAADGESRTGDNSFIGISDCAAASRPAAEGILRPERPLNDAPDHRWDEPGTRIHFRCDSRYVAVRPGDGCPCGDRFRNSVGVVRIDERGSPDRGFSGALYPLFNYIDALRSAAPSLADPNLHLVEGTELIPAAPGLFDGATPGPADAGFSIMAHRLAEKGATPLPERKNEESAPRLSRLPRQPSSRGGTAAPFLN